MDEFEELLSWIEDPKNAQPVSSARESKADHLDDFDKMFQQMSSVQKQSATGPKQDPRISLLLQDLGQEMEYEKKKQAAATPASPKKIEPKIIQPKQTTQTRQNFTQIEPKSVEPPKSAGTKTEEEAANELIAQLLGHAPDHQPQPILQNQGMPRTLSQQLQRDAETLARELEEEALSLALKQPVARYVPPASVPSSNYQQQPVVDIRQMEQDRQNQLRTQQVEQAKARAAAQRAQAEAAKPGAVAMFLCPGCQLPVQFGDKQRFLLTKKWHVECCKCPICQNLIGGVFKEEGGVAYCSAACAKARFKRR